MRTMLVTLLALASATSVPAQRRQAPPQNVLTSVRAFRCSFPAYGMAQWTAQGPSSTSGQDTFTFDVNTIDLKRGAARIVGAGGATAEATAMLSETGLNVIEQTPIGNFILTTIFVGGASADKYFAVHSRHLGDLTTPPSASQYYGTCEVAD